MECNREERMETQWKGIKMDGQILLNRKRVRFGRVFGMEIRNNIRSMSKFVGG